MVTSAGTAQVMIGQLTDTHVLGANVDPASIGKRADHNERLRIAVESMLAEPVRVDAVVASGDLANDARLEEYDALVELLEPLGERLLPLPGNHDDPAEVRRRFPNAPWADVDHSSWVTDIGGVRLVGLDTTRSLVPGTIEHGGEVDERRAAWLDDVLGAPHDGLTVLAMHHPPFMSGIWWMDQYGFEGLGLLGDVLDAHSPRRRVDRIMCGHLHRPMTSMFHGAVAEVGMSTVEHVGLDLVPGEDVTVVNDPVGYQLLDVRFGGDEARGGDTTRAVMHRRVIEPLSHPIVPTWASEFR